MAAAPVSNPGLDLSWLNLDEWGARAEPGKRGLTLDDLITYGDAPIDANPAAKIGMRGAAPDARSPRHRNQYRTKADVWSDSARLL